ncbi:MAG: hypothetical protein WBY94_18440 [Polyangiaceae bacterium]
MCPRSGSDVTLEAMRPHALPEYSFVRLVVEDGVALAARKAAGAEIVLEMLRMEGPIVA